MSRLPQKPAALSFDSVATPLREAEFDVEELPTLNGQLVVSKYGCAAILGQSAGAVVLIARPGFVLGGEISRLLDRGNQKFLKTSTLEAPATADHLRAIHRFSEELKLITGSISLYNESLGTVSDRYVYDRLKGRDKPESERTPRPWETPALPGK
jgi:hypothetical protein